MIAKIAILDNDGHSTFMEHKLQTLEDVFGDKLPANLSKEEREKLEYITIDHIQDFVDAINNSPLGGIIKATRI